MGTIAINFKNLCALFTKYLDDATNPRLMAGLLNLADLKMSDGSSVLMEDYHYPRVTIYPLDLAQNKISNTPTVYQGFSDLSTPLPLPADATGALVFDRAVNGEIVFDVPYMTKGIKQPKPGVKTGELLTTLAGLGIIPEPKNGMPQQPLAPDRFKQML